MLSALHSKYLVVAGLAAGLLFSAGLNPSTYAQTQDPRVGHEPVDIVVVVKEAATGDPISQARVTLQFKEPAGPARPWKFNSHTYNAKTDTEGRCKLTGINKGKIVLSVTAPNHQAYGKELDLEQEGQVFEVKLKKPQPLI